MACFRPMLGFRGGINPETGKHRISVFAWNEKLEEELKKENSDYFPIPCGKCIGCRQDYARQWTDRMIMEMADTEDAWFVTLTYDNDYVPKAPVVDENGEVKSWTLTTHMDDVSKFMKHVRRRFPASIKSIHYERKALDPDYPLPQIRFFASSEYGTKTLRPHYHLIIFNLHLDESLLIPLKKDNKGHWYYDCPELKKCWSNYVGQDKHGKPIFDPIGNIMISPVNNNTINYVAQYTNKKASQDLNKYVTEFNLEPPKTRCSRKPGLGWYWYYDHVDEVKDYTGFFVSTNEGSREVNTPEYFYRLLSKTDEKLVEQKKADKSIVGQLAFKRITESIQKPYRDYLRDKELNTKLSLKRKQSNFNRDKI